jgi:hypothetical protein
LFSSQRRRNSSDFGVKAPPATISQDTGAAYIRCIRSIYESLDGLPSPWRRTRGHGTWRPPGRGTVMNCCSSAPRSSPARHQSVDNGVGGLRRGQPCPADRRRARCVQRRVAPRRRRAPGQHPLRGRRARSCSSTSIPATPPRWLRAPPLVPGHATGMRSTTSTRQARLGRRGGGLRGADSSLTGLERENCVGRIEDYLYPDFGLAISPCA